MRVPRIFTPSALSVGQQHELDETAANHVVRVLRMQAGQPLILFNGDGHDYTAVLDKVGKRDASVRIDSAIPIASESPLHIILGQVISKGDRMDYAVQKSVEMGVSAIVPLVSERCDVRLKGDREDKRVRHWQQVASSAAEQCGRARVPDIAAIENLTDWLQQLPEHDLGLVLHHRTTQSLTSLPRPGRLIILIGPEGGLTEAEIAAAEAAGFMATTLGPRVLRTETAPVAAMAVCQWLWGDFNI